MSTVETGTKQPLSGDNWDDVKYIVEYTDGYEEYIKQQNNTLAEELMLLRFSELEKRMEKHYFWCKVKLNSYAVFLLIMLMLLR